MIKFLLVAVLVCGTFASLPGGDCFKKLAESSQVVRKALEMDLSNEKIDAITNLINQVPKTLGLCLGEQVQQQFSTELPAVCVADLNKAAKIGLRLQKQKENQLLFSKDLLLLERHFQTKVKKDCPLLTDVTLQDIKDNAKCMEDSYRLSLVVQKLAGDINKADKKAVVADLDKIFTQLPAVLDTCGKSEWANEVRKYLPMNCIHALEDLIAELAVVEHHYSHFEWLIKNYKDVQAYVAMVRMHCPFAKL